MEMQKIGVIVQARTSSTRLPNKVLKPLPYGSEVTVLEQVIRRLKKSKLINVIIVATTTGDEDIPVIKIAEKEGVDVFRGSKENVLERYYMAAKSFEVSMIVRVTSDCPCIDHNVIDLTISEHINSKADYTANNIERTFPYGLDVEVFSFYALESAFNNATEWYEKEHVTPYINKTKKKTFKLHNVPAPKSFAAPNLRITLDTQEDYAMLCAIYDYLYYENNFFGLPELIGLLRQKPWLELINKNIVQKKIFDTIGEEMQAAIKLLDMQDMKRAKQLLQDLVNENIKTETLY